MPFEQKQHFLLPLTRETTQTTDGLKNVRLDDDHGFQLGSSKTIQYEVCPGMGGKSGFSGRMNGQNSFKFCVCKL